MDQSHRFLVCFDLGGVLAQIRRTWQACAEAAGVATRLRADEVYEMVDFPLFDVYQMGRIGNVEYLSELGTYLGVSPDDARKVHDAILIGPYPGTHELVRELKQNGVATACLSNTNAIHWETLNSEVFPAIRDLDYKVVSHTINLVKPEPALFRLFDTDTQMSPQFVAFFDDHEGNVEAAQEHGWRAVLVDHQGDPAGQMREALVKMEVLPATPAR